MTTTAVTCPFCDSDDVERVGAWGGQMITSQLRCRGCNTYFEAIREEFSSSEGLADRARDGHG